MQAIIDKMAFFSIRQKLLGGFAIVLFMLVIIAMNSLSSLSDTQVKVDNMAREIQPTLIASMKLSSTLQEASKALGFFLLTKEDERKQDYIDYLAKLDSALAELKATPVVQKNEETMAMVAEIEADVIQFQGYQPTMIKITSSVNENFLAVRHAADNMNPINSEFFQTISNMLLSEDDEETSEERKELTKSITNLRYAWSNLTNNARIFLTFGSQEILENIKLFTSKAETLIKEIEDKADILTFEQEEGLETLEPMRALWVQHLDTLVGIHRGEKARIDAYLLRKKIGPLLNKIDGNLKALLNEQQTNIQNTSEELISQTENTYRFVVILFILGLIASVAVSLLITSMITKPLNAAADAMRDIADGEGDLTLRLRVTGRDEIAKLAGGFNQFVDKIQNIITQVSESTMHMAKATEDMTSATAITNETTEKQKSETDQAATAITELSATSHEVAQNAELASDAATSADNETSQGRDIVNKALDSIHTMGENIEKNADIVEQLGSDISDITSIIDSIQGIAEQTNLLALNAAIEAARAGEQGRGFAVVADEVRTLATRTKQSTQDIQDKVEALQKIASHVVDSILENRESAKSTIELATDAGTSLDAITSAVSSITDMVTQIASAAEEQSVVSEEVNKGIVNINELADVTNQEAQQLSFSSMDLTQVTGTLRELVGQFKIK